MTDVIRMGDCALELLCASAVRAAMTQCAEAFHAATGRGFELRFDTSGGVVKRMMAGEAADLVVSSQASLEKLAEAGRLASSPLALGASRVALGVRTGEPAPDISTVEKFRAALLAAKRFARGDPAGGGTAGAHLERVLAELGLLEAVADSSVLRVGGYNVMAAVAQGLADFGLTQSTEIGPVEGVEIGAWLPDALQVTTVYAAARGQRARGDDLASDFFAALSTSNSAQVFDDLGFFPVSSAARGA